jgi:hypothetical protein
MKRLIKLNETEFKKLIIMISEQIDLNDYRDEDFIEVFINHFRPWVKLKHGDEVGEYPMSLLVEKYFDEFAKDLGMDDRFYGTRSSNLVRVGREIVRLGKHTLKSLKSGIRFTKKYGNALNMIVNQLDLPDFVTIKFTEDAPFKVWGQVIVDYPKMVKTEGEKINLSTHQIRRKLEEYINNFMGIQFGNASHGKLDLNVHSSIDYVGVDEGIKQVLNKQIKKKIKELPDAKRCLHSIRYSVDNSNFYSTMKLIFTSYTRWDTQNDFKRQVRELLTEMGYNPEYIKVEH